MLAVPPIQLPASAPQVFHASGGNPPFMKANMTTNPIMIVMVAEKNPTSILGPSFMIFRMSQRSSIRKIIAGIRLPRTTL